MKTLLEAAKNCNAEEVRLALKNGSDVNERDENGWTALMLAVHYGTYGETAKVLIKANADVNAKSKHGYTALSLAAEQGKYKMVDILKKKMSGGNQI